MKAFLRTLVVCLVALSFVQEVRAQAVTESDLSPACVTAGYCSNTIARIGQYSNGDFTITGDELIFNNSATITYIRRSTVDGADNKNLQITGAGAASDARGAYLSLSGNESAGTGVAILAAGDVSGGDVILQVDDASGDVIIQDETSGALWTFSNAGALTGSSTLGGDIVFGRSGRTISVQEATASTACMGAATPNGTTPVTVTTSCAVTGSRVFFARAGAVTNMGTITTTTAPNNTSFAFASTGASDTLASSVIYLIVKESA